MRNHITRTFQYGALEPHAGLDLAMHQHLLRQRHWNALARWENHRRWRVRQIVIPLLEAGMTRKEAFREKCREINALNMERTDFVRLQRQAAVREGLYFPGYHDIEKAWNKARMSHDAPKEKRLGEHQAGSINFPFTNGLPVANLWGTDNRVQIEAVDLDIYETRKERRRNQRTTMRLRIGSSCDRKPIWLELSIFLHRPLPKDADIRDVRVTWCTIGSTRRWSVNIVFRTAAPVRRPEGASVAVQLAWRKVNRGIRAGYWVGSDGKRGEVFLEDTFIQRWRKVRELQSIRDHHCNALKVALQAWLGSAPGVPKWAKQQAARMHVWRGYKRFRNMYRCWRDGRWHADDAGFMMMHTWFLRDRHLHEWQDNLRDKLIHQRREIYRLIAVQLVAHYNTLVIEASDLGRVAEGEKGTKSYPETVQGDRVMVSPSSLRTALIDVFEREGAHVVRIDSKHAVILYQLCRHKGVSDVQGYQGDTCVWCGTSWEQEENACLNLLQLTSLQAAKAVA